ncbi:MAG: hypothetical protein QW265_05740, partial [Candidatus Bathyarchaeia archaeon]
TIFCKKGCLPILLPYWLFYKKDPFKPSWDITSDSISVHVAHLLKAKKLILVKDVDGVCNKSGRVLKKVSLEWLGRNKTCLDRHFPRMMEKKKLKSYVVNGFYPKRLERLLEGKKTLCTEVLS